ncbi:VOC family protein [Polymorphobacter sp.]|uniref:VOC family protein n=1 Tax=Polymorphobacter sp. TaxID=1909290 RepID=UPI003F6E9112
MIIGVHHLAISTPDIDRFVDYYHRMFGFEQVGGGGWEPGNDRIDRMVGLPASSARYAMIRLSTLHIEVFEYTAPRGHAVHPRMCDHGLTHLCLYTNDIEADYQRLAAQGMAFNCPPGGSGATRATYGQDCDGNTVELLQIVDDACGFAYPG